MSERIGNLMLIYVEKIKVIQSINSHFTSMAKILNRKSQRGD